MTKRKITSQLSTIMQQVPGLLHAYLGGSFNTPFFTDLSDLDVILIWNQRPSVRDRTDLLERIQKVFNLKMQWSYVDANDRNSRDAIKLQNFRKIEVYHHDLASLQQLLELQSHKEGLSFSLNQRLPLFYSPEMEAFIESYAPDLTSELQNLYFEIMTLLNEKPEQEIIVEKILKLFSLSQYRGIPSSKHKDKILKTLPGSHLLTQNRIKEWLEEFRPLLLTWGQTAPREILTTAQGFELRKHSPSLNADIFQMIQSQKERLGEFLSWPKHIQTMGDQNKFSERADRQWEYGVAYHFQIYHKDTFAGGISLHSMNYKEKSFEFGYWIDQEAQGRGLVSQGLSLLMEHMASKGWAKAKITSNINNHRSRNIAEKLGMTPESGKGLLITYGLHISHSAGSMNSSPSGRGFSKE